MDKATGQITNERLHRELKNRHIQLIALGGSVGTGLFYGIAPTIHGAGPVILLGYLIAGFFAFLIMRQLGEMIVEQPVAGSFSYFANKYWGQFGGYISGWNYWMLYVLVGMSELTAAAMALSLFIDVPIWILVLCLFVIINMLNLSVVKFYGEAEFWLAIIKILAIIGIIGYGTYLLLFGNNELSSVSNLWKYGGFVPNGMKAFILVMPIIMFSFGGLDLIGITAAEASNPEEVIPKATNQVLVRILLFYVGSIFILLSLFPWTMIPESKESSPFVLMFQQLDVNTLALIIHIVVFTAALSAYNSATYCTGRMLYSISLQNNAPKKFKKLNSKGSPSRAVLVSSVVSFVVVIINFYAKNALTFLIFLVVASLILNWILITLTHIKFRQAQDKNSYIPKFKALFYPWGNYITLLFLFGILVIMLFAGMTLPVLFIPIWLAILSLGYYLQIGSKQK